MSTGKFPRRTKIQKRENGEGLKNEFRSFAFNAVI